eukprot:4997687-Pleurochrysis_carterae.AAC.1
MALTPMSDIMPPTCAPCQHRSYARAPIVCVRARECEPAGLWPGAQMRNARVGLWVRVRSIWVRVPVAFWVRAAAHACLCAR